MSRRDVRRSSYLSDTRRRATGLPIQYLTDLPRHPTRATTNMEGEDNVSRLRRRRRRSNRETSSAGPRHRRRSPCRNRARHRVCNLKLRQMRALSMPFVVQALADRTVLRRLRRSSRTRPRNGLPLISCHISTRNSTSTTSTSSRRRCTISTKHHHNNSRRHRRGSSSSNNNSNRYLGKSRRRHRLLPSRDSSIFLPTSSNTKENMYVSRQERGSRTCDCE